MGRGRGAREISHACRPPSQDRGATASCLPCSPSCPHAVSPPRRPSRLLFNSLTFLVFFAVVLAVHSLPLPWRWRKSHLLFASYIFYAAWNPPFIVLLWFSTMLDWVAAKGVYNARTPARRRAWLWL